MEFKGADQDSTTVPGYLPPFLLISPMRILWCECDTVIEEMEKPNLTNTTPYLQACMDCGLDSRLYAWIC